MSDSGLLRCSLTRNPISSVANPCCNRVLVGVVPAVVKAMRRRDFIEVIAGSIAALPLAARAQAGKMPIIGLMGSGTQAAQSQWTSAFLDRLRELGWTEGRNIAIEYRWAEGRNERFAEIATAGDPVGTGIVASLARPGGNVTGLSGQAPDIAERRLEFLREVVPGLRRLGFLSDVDNPLTALEKSELQKAARTLAIEVAIFGIRRNEDIAAAFEAFRDRVDALYVAAHPTIFMNRIRINTFALAARLPTMYTVREYVEAGGLMSYGPNWPSMWRRAADLVDKILHGTKPADIPVEQPTRFDLVLNLTTAKALGFKIPDKLLALADEVIE